MRSTFVLPPLVLAAIACSAPVATPQPTKLEPNMSGGTLYVVECYEDWLDDGHDITNGFQDGGRTRWMGEQALRIALRSLDGGQKARIVHSRQFDLQEGQLSHVFLPEPIHYFQPTEDGKF